MGKIGKKKGDEEEVSKSNHVERKLKKRQATRVMAKEIETQFNTGRLYAKISSRPGQSGRCDGFILEGAELKFYLRGCRRRSKPSPQLLSGSRVSHSLNADIFK